jgi:hypothetical protein
MEEVCHLGLTLRDVRLTFNPVRAAEWVNITRLSYGIPNVAIAAAVKPYGKVRLKWIPFMEFMLGSVKS